MWLTVRGFVPRRLENNANKLVEATVCAERVAIVKAVVSGSLLRCSNGKRSNSNRLMPGGTERRREGVCGAGYYIVSQLRVALGSRKLNVE